MSVARIALLRGSRFAATATPSVFRTTLRNAAPAVQGVQQHMQPQQFQTRQYWQEIFHEGARKNSDIPEYDDEAAANEVEAMAVRMDRTDNGERMDARKNRFIEHEKKWMKRKRVANQLEHRIKKTKVMELLRYVQWKEESKK
jgi:hypothetical protein